MISVKATLANFFMKPIFEQNHFLEQKQNVNNPYFILIKARLRCKSVIMLKVNLVVKRDSFYALLGVDWDYACKQTPATVAGTNFGAATR